MTTKQARAAQRPTGTLLTLREAATRLGIIPRTLKRWIAKGEFPQPIRKGSRWVRVPESVLDAWLQARAADAKPLRSKPKDDAEMAGVQPTAQPEG